MSQLIISLDFELLWGVRDRQTVDSYGLNILGARSAIPRILDLFAHEKIGATWATVGLLFCEDRDEMLARIDRIPVRPTYDNPRLSSYAYLGEVGKNEREDPFSYGLSLIQSISQTPGQRIGTHTFSHYYCLEPGAGPEALRADLRAALAVAHDRGFEVESIVFPRNQYDEASLDVCRRLGIKSFRGNAKSWLYAPAARAGQSALRRAGRLIDAYTGCVGDMSVTAHQEGGLVNLPASRFLRPGAGSMKALAPLHIATVGREMERAARQGRDYHLWWHPHNFGRDTDANIEGLKKIIATFNRLRDTYGMGSTSMESAV